MLKRAVMIAILLSFSGASCVPAVSRAPATDNKPAAAVWTEINGGLSRYECLAAKCDVRLIIFKFSKDAFNWRFENSAAVLTVEGWLEKFPKAGFVSNGVYFDENGAPTGFFTAQGKRVGAKEFDRAKSAVVSLSPSPTIIDTTKTKSDLGLLTEAAQSYPLLVASGKAAKVVESGKASRRTFIGIDGEGNGYLGYVPEDAITLADLAKLLASLDIKWDNVLNLDGGTSTGFAARLEEYSETMNSIVQVPNVIVVEKK